MTGSGLGSGRGLRGAHPVEWLYLLLGAVLVWRRFFLFDDAFVYFRYVDNWLWLDLGLVYNAGEYVEGFTSPLWALAAAALRATGASWTAITRATSLLGLLAFWWLGVRLRQRLAPDGPVLNLPLAWLCPLYAVTSWFSSGSETAMLQVLAPAYALFAVAPGSAALQLLLALSPLVRHELVPSLAVALLFAWRVDRRAALRVAGLAAASTGAWLAFRIVYYADLLPNTFYLKHGFDPRQGLVYLHDALRPYHLYALAALFAALALALRRRGVAIHGRARLAMLAAALPVALYAVAVGGTSIHYRFLAFPIALAVFATAGLAERGLLVFTPRLARPLAPALGLLCAALAASLTPPQLDSPDYDVGQIGDAAYHRARIGQRGEVEEGRPAARLREAASHPALHREVIVTGWCAGAWQKLGVRVVHRHGLTDAVLARTDAPGARPGHRGGAVRRMALDLARLQRAVLEAGGEVGAGLFRRAVDEGRAPAWVAASLPALERLERQVHNRHRPLENLRIALSPTPHIPPPAPE